MAKINFEAITLLGGDFITFNECEEVTIVDGDAESGFHLISRGNVQGMWSNPDYGEWHLKIGRIALMKEGEEWIVSHNNWYGKTEKIILQSKEAFDDNTTTLILKWVREVEKEEEEYSEVSELIVSVETSELEQYRKKHNVLHHFVYEMNIYEDMMNYHHYLQKCEDIE